MFGVNFCIFVLVATTGFGGGAGGCTRLIILAMSPGHHAPAVASAPIFARMPGAISAMSTAWRCMRSHTASACKRDTMVCCAVSLLRIKSMRAQPRRAITSRGADMPANDKLQEGEPTNGLSNNLLWIRIYND